MPWYTNQIVVQQAVAAVEAVQAVVQSVAVVEAVQAVVQSVAVVEAVQAVVQQAVVVVEAVQAVAVVEAVQAVAVVEAVQAVAVVEAVQAVAVVEAVQAVAVVEAVQAVAVVKAVQAVAVAVFEAVQTHISYILIYLVTYTQTWQAVHTVQAVHAHTYVQKLHCHQVVGADRSSSSITGRQWPQQYNRQYRQTRTPRRTNSTATMGWPEAMMRSTKGR